MTETGHTQEEQETQPEVWEHQGYAGLGERHALQVDPARSK